MKTGFTLKKAISILLMILVLTLLCNVFMMRVSATQTTTISVTPADQTIGKEGVELPTPPHTISITVTNVTNLLSWQIKLYFDNTTLMYEEAWLPPDHVFAGKANQPTAPVVRVDENGTYVWYACTLISVDVFTGSGTLCQINFTGIAPGSSSLTFDMTKRWNEPMQRWENVNTYLLDPNFIDIPFDASDGSITVQGIPTGKKISVITFDVITPDPKHPGEAHVGSDVIISGAITPVQGVVNVIIQYKEAGTVEWTTLAEVTTDSESRYTHTWTPTEMGTYEIRAYWPGDEDSLKGYSDAKRVDIIGGITIDLSQTKVVVGSDVTISGAITPVQGVVDVLIYYRDADAAIVEWDVLANVTTDSESRYTYTWTTTETGTYEIRAYWPGGGWFSVTESVKVTEEAIDIVPYAIAGVVAVIIILAIVTYFIKFRKRE